MAINKVGSKGIEDGSVATVDLAPGTVTNAKLTNSSFTFDGTSISLGGSDSVSLSASWQSVITADGSTGTTAVAGNGYFIDTTSAAHTLTLPASATIGDFIAIKDYAGTFNTNNLTIARNGHNIQGVANDSLIQTNRASLVLVYVDSTKGWLYWEEHNVADLEKTLYITATGGTITTSGDFKIHTFTGDGCFVVSQSGAGAGPSNVDYLVIAGGGGGGAGGGAFAGGGGGAGGYRTTFPSPGCNAGAFPISAATYPITVGAGGGPGAPGNCGGAVGVNGSNSVFSTITSSGGGGGGSSEGQPTAVGSNGGSGGGGGTATPNNLGGSGNTPPVSPPQGNDGGRGGTGTTPGPAGLDGGGGGGGASAVGTDRSGDSGGPGGNGLANSITGSPVTRAGGGGGGSTVYADGGATSGSGGSGGGGNGGGTPPNRAGSNGTANTGGGGGAGGWSPSPSPVLGGTGGKGIVIIRYKFQ